MTTYRVKDWVKHFENNKSRERAQCSYVCVPNKQHGMGFARVMAEPDGAAIYGIWVMILGACSQQKAPRAGWLAADGHQAGTAWAPTDLALKFRRPVAEIERALSVLASMQVDWLEKVEAITEPKCPPGARQVPADCLPAAPEEKRREENGIEGKEGEGSAVAAPPPAEFSEERDGLSNHPPLAAIHAWSISENGPRNEDGKLFTDAEVRTAFRSYETTQRAGYWYRGKALVGDWRAAISERLEDNRKRGSGIGATRREPSILDLKTIMAAKQQRADALAEKHKDGDGKWRDQATKDLYVLLKREAREINEKISQMA